jgi:hypothetical protein
MGYTVFIFKKEVSKNKSPEFLENPNLIADFSVDEFNKLKEKLILYKYNIESEKESVITFNHSNAKYGITAKLFKNQLALSSGFDQDGLFEIMQTSSEFVSSEFAKYDPQDNSWETD